MSRNRIRFGIWVIDSPPTSDIGKIHFFWNTLGLKVFGCALSRALSYNIVTRIRKRVPNWRPIWLFRIIGLLISDEHWNCLSVEVWFVQNLIDSRVDFNRKEKGINSAKHFDRQLNPQNQVNQEIGVESIIGWIYSVCFIGFSIVNHRLFVKLPTEKKLNFPRNFKLGKGGARR